VGAQKTRTFVRMQIIKMLLFRVEIEMGTALGIGLEAIPVTS
jgi:hypothetical protein